MAPPRIPVRSPASSWQRVDGEMVVLHADAAKLVGLNRVGARAWELFDGVRSVDEVVATIAAEFAAPPERVAADVEAFVIELQAAKLIDIKDRSP